MKSWIIGLLFVCIIVAGGIIYSSGFAAKNGAPDEQGSGITQTNTETQNVMSAAIDSLETSSSVDGKVTASALACSIKNEGDYVVDLRLINPGTETRAITIDPSGTKIDLLPDQIKRFDLHLGTEPSILNLLVDDGTELQVQSPPCIASGSSGSSSEGNGVSTPTKQKSPPPPVPELSPLVLTIAGITGLLLVSRIRKN